MSVSPETVAADARAAGYVLVQDEAARGFYLLINRTTGGACVRPARTLPPFAGATAYHYTLAQAHEAVLALKL